MKSDSLFRWRERTISKPQFDRKQMRPQGPRINDRIRIPEIRVIGPQGEVLGVMRTDDARRMAREQNLDLVEVNPKASPPVCKIMDYGRFKYEEKKKMADAKRRQTQVEIKEIKLRPKTDDHDIDFKVKHIRRFLDEGNKVKITVRFRGREITHPETAQRQIDIIVRAVADIGVVELTPRMEAKTMTAMIAPRPKVGTVRKPVSTDGKPPAAVPPSGHVPPAGARSAGTAVRGSGPT